VTQAVKAPKDLIEDAYQPWTVAHDRGALARISERLVDSTRRAAGQSISPIRARTLTCARMSAELSRRELLRAAARLGVAPPTLAALAALAARPERPPARQRLPDIQFDVADRFAPARTIEGVVARFPPVYTSCTTVALTRRPRPADAERLRRALAHVEARFAPSPRGVLALVAL
jgi:hypothetical protein